MKLCELRKIIERESYKNFLTLISSIPKAGNGKIQIEGDKQDPESRLAGAIRPASLRGPLPGPGAGGDGLGPGQEPPGRSDGQDDDRPREYGARNYPSPLAGSRGRCRSDISSADDKRHHCQRDDKRSGRSRGNATGTGSSSSEIRTSEHSSEAEGRWSSHCEGITRRFLLIDQIQYLHLQSDPLSSFSANYYI